MSASRPSSGAGGASPRRYEVDGFPGALTRAEIWRLARNGAIGPESLVSREGKAEPQPAGVHPDLEGLFGQRDEAPWIDRFGRELDRKIPMRRGFAVLMGVALLLTGIWSGITLTRVHDWSSVEGRVTHVFSRTGRNAEGEVSRRPMIRYRYRAGGRDHVNTTRKPLFVSALDGRPITVYYDPENPGNSVLSRVDLIPRTIGGIAGGLLLLGLQIRHLARRRA